MDYVKKINDILKKIIQEKELPDNSIQLNEQDNVNEGEYLIQIFEPEYPLAKDNVKGTVSPVLIVKEEHGKSAHLQGKVNLIFKEYILNKFDVPEDAEILGGGNDNVKVRMPETSNELYDLIEKVVRYKVENYSSNSNFACCSHFNECSNARKCVHPNKLYATGCTYYSLHLKKGEIFYGNNPNK